MFAACTTRGASIQLDAPLVSDTSLAQVTRAVRSFQDDGSLPSTVYLIFIDGSDQSVLARWRLDGKGFWGPVRPPELALGGLSLAS
ncbi:hypothetical protein [Allostreptomyces psammosilenae]|uniref:Uncharacterized protein n=1 Tax=Allostreptomyces psammosilenae TaxID=1892865 RepID=A0A853ACK7_9ACTN|nr:hypothetical protein [Allostreptomyces psammosilenae]NYI08092.1 hypothetical protein [Allostreptomyces psammosilenae]